MAESTKYLRENCKCNGDEIPSPQNIFGSIITFQFREITAHVYTAPPEYYPRKRDAHRTVSLRIQVWMDTNSGGAHVHRLDSQDGEEAHFGFYSLSIYNITFINDDDKQ